MKIAVVLVILAATAAVHARPHAHAESCGEERAAVKLGTDQQARQVPPAPVNATIAELALRPRPANTPEDTRARDERGTELTMWRVTGQVIAYKLEEDGDYHLVIADAAGNHMIAEIPAAECAKAGVWADQIAAARALAARQLHPTARAYWTTAPPTVTITGPGFFDKLHGQLGVAKNGIEIHPVVSIQFGGGS